jgi:hypothetical protein
VAPDQVAAGRAEPGPGQAVLADPAPDQEEELAVARGRVGEDDQRPWRRGLLPRGEVILTTAHERSWEMRSLNIVVAMAALCGWPRSQDCTKPVACS